MIQSRSDGRSTRSKNITKWYKVDPEEIYMENVRVEVSNDPPNLEPVIISTDDLGE